MTETEARKAFTTARTDLQGAIKKYDAARIALHRITGEFHGADQKLSLQFSSAVALATADDSDQPAKADC
ncbi:hypothetical protein AVMA1855_06660 [Acidovorax sp. SUPP1855]|uniref:hypothetical protein n=1 Tax=Acidovorax sp. SUPP1855 TaxID=431774 RepID=UPI0023DE64E5|nr:hypothetical protein [Acidovorax sp. SUPP1855]GKS83806.1 hypothetical protein AVMA1855_06660 [Acidovorax sp. SUPP1855]